MIRYPQILERTFEVRPRWRRRDAMLYALALGYGEDPLDETELAIVARPSSHAMPTLAAVMASAANPVRESGFESLLNVHLEQVLTMHAPMPSEGPGLVTARIAAVYDRGEGRGALVVADAELRNEAGDALIATSRSLSLARDDGGFGGPPPPPLTPPWSTDRAPDAVIELTTRPGQALLYRLSGDYNPLHFDPERARKAGFLRPILHGLCTYGMAARAILQTCAGHDPTRLVSHRARFSSPVYPGDTLRVDLWRQEDELDEIRFRVSVPARDVVVLADGATKLVSGR